VWKSENSNKDLKTMKLYIEEKEMLTSSVDHQNTTETESQHKKKWMDEWINEWMDELLIKKKKEVEFHNGPLLSNDPLLSSSSFSK